VLGIGVIPDEGTLVFVTEAQYIKALQDGWRKMAIGEDSVTATFDAAGDPVVPE
jgi:hypothetical protein